MSVYAPFGGGLLQPDNVEVPGGLLVQNVPHVLWNLGQGAGRAARVLVYMVLSCTQ